MSYETLVIALNWYGPFKSIEAASKEAKKAGATGALYLAISNIHKRTRAYVGIATDVARRLTEGQHEKLSGFAEGVLDIWIGTVASQGVAGRNPDGGSKLHSRILRTSERTLAYFLQLSENTQLRKSTPKEAIILINRWFDPAEPYNRKDQRGHPEWPDLIEHDPEGGQASLVWFGQKRLERLDQTEINDLMVQ